VLPAFEPKKPHAATLKLAWQEVEFEWAMSRERQKKD